MLWQTALGALMKSTLKHIPTLQLAEEVGVGQKVFEVISSSDWVL